MGSDGTRVEPHVEHRFHGGGVSDSQDREEVVSKSFISSDWNLTRTGSGVEARGRIGVGDDTLEELLSGLGGVEKMLLSTFLKAARLRAILISAFGISTALIVAVSPGKIKETTVADVVMVTSTEKTVIVRTSVLVCLPGNDTENCVTESCVQKIK